MSTQFRIDPASLPPSQRGGWDRSDLVLYGGVVVALVVGGALVRTWLLNWISGPIFVVVFVAGVRTLIDRRRAKTPTEPRRDGR